MSKPRLTDAEREQVRREAAVEALELLARSPEFFARLGEAADAVDSGRLVLCDGNLPAELIKRLLDHKLIRRVREEIYAFEGAEELREDAELLAKVRQRGHQRRIRINLDDL